MMTKNLLNTLKQIPTSREEVHQKLVEIRDQFAEEKQETVEMWRIYELHIYGLATDEEVKWANDQALDVIRAVGLAGIIVLPGTVFVLPVLVKVANRFNVNILPSSFRK
jgi:hypothetical protein